MRSFEIREAVPEDAEAVLRFRAALVAERLPVLFEKSALSSLAEQQDWIRKLTDPAAGVVLIAVVGPDIIGLLDVHREQRPQSAHVATFGISVAGDQRGRGVGTALLQRMLAWATGVGITRIEMQVFENNPAAVRLYERLGFHHEGRRRGAVFVGGRAIDVLLMARLAG